MKKSGFKNKQRKPMKRSGFMSVHKAKTGFLAGIPVATYKTNLKRTLWGVSKPVTINTKNVNRIFRQALKRMEKSNFYLNENLKKGFTGKYEGVKIWKAKKPLLKRSTFKQKPQKPLRRTKLRLVGHSSTTELKNEIQALLRQITILRDGGCILRNWRNEITPRYQDCGGYRKDGELILQAEHLHTRSNISTFADTRLVVCLCQRHHMYYKPQHSDEYFEIVKKHIGKERADLLKRVQEDRGVHRGIDLKMELLGLKKELQVLQDKEKTNV